MGWRYPSPNGYFVPLVDTIWHPWERRAWGGVVMTRPNGRQHIANQRRAESQQ
jgi:hypothetical protein